MQLNKKTSVVISSLAILASCSTESNTQKKDLKDISFEEKPNILWITCEDISPYLGCYGDSLAYTPNLDKLASEGIKFNNAFSVAGVSAPSRCGLITGCYPTSIGGHNMRTQGNKYGKSLGFKGYSIVTPDSVKCFSEYLRQNGYFTTNNVKTDYQFKAPISAWDENSHVAHWRHRKEGQPFFSVFNLVITHESRLWANDWYRYVIDPDSVDVPPYFPDTPEVREMIARSYSNITMMDAEVGALLKQLKEDGLMENTIIFFFSDHGGPFPRHKREMLETGLKVPFIVRLPNKVNAGTEVNDLVSFVDFGATVLSLAGIDIPNSIQGQAFMGTQKEEPRKYIFAGRDRMDTEYDRVRAARDKQFKYLRNYYPEKPFVQNIRYRKQIPAWKTLALYDSLDLYVGVQKLWWRKTKPKEELYDIINDPYEFNNLAGDPNYKEKLDEMRVAMDSWQSNYGDLGAVPELELIKKMWGGDNQPIVDSPNVKIEEELLTLSCKTPGSSVSYKFKAGDNWSLYKKPVSLNEEIDSVFVIAERIGYKSVEQLNLINK